MLSAFGAFVGGLGYGSFQSVMFPGMNVGVLPGIGTGVLVGTASLFYGQNNGWRALAAAALTAALWTAFDSAGIAFFSTDGTIPVLMLWGAAGGLAVLVGTSVGGAPARLPVLFWCATLLVGAIANLGFYIPTDGQMVLPAGSAGAVQIGAIMGIVGLFLRERGVHSWMGRR